MQRDEFLPWASRFPDALLLVDGAGAILACNGALTELLGRTEEQLQRGNLLDWAPSGPDRVRSALRLWSGSGRMVFGPAPFHYPGVGDLRCEGAIVLPAASRAASRLMVRIKRKATAAERFLEVNRKIEDLHAEIRARKRSEEAIAKQKEWFHVTLSSIGDAVIATDIHGNIEYLNSVAEHLTGWPLSEAMGKPVVEVFIIVDERTREPVPSPAHQAIREQRIVALANHTILRARSGFERPIEDSAAPIRNTTGALIGAVVVFHDISKQHAARAAVERARDEALAASRAKDDFLAALSHELRTPLNPALLLASQASANPDLPREIRRDFATIEKHILLEARLIDDLLDLTKVAHGKLSLDLKPVNLADVIRDSLETVGGDIDRKPLKVTLDLGAANHHVLGDRTRLQQVIWNVVNNAVKFTQAEGSLHIATREEAEGKLALEITDNGIGIAASELPRLFVPFSQGDHRRINVHQFGGLGLGLAISRVIMELHQGQIKATSPGEGKGATISIILPTIPREPLGSTSPLIEVSDTAVSHDGRMRRLLLVEDHEPTRRTTARLLTARKYEVRTAASVAEALRMADLHRFDLVVSDIGLPDGDGLSLMRALNERHQLRGIALSGYGMDQDRARSQECGFVTHLTKPITMHAMESALAEFWAKTEPRG